jgi:hypothetical protein
MWVHYRFRDALKIRFLSVERKATMRQVGEADIDALQEVDHN